MISDVSECLSRLGALLRARSGLALRAFGLGALNNLLQLGHDLIVRHRRARVGEGLGHLLVQPRQVGRFLFGRAELGDEGGVGVHGVRIHERGVRLQTSDFVTQG